VVVAADYWSPVPLSVAVEWSHLVPVVAEASAAAFDLPRRVRWWLRPLFPQWAGAVAVALAEPVAWSMPKYFCSKPPSAKAVFAHQLAVTRTVAAVDPPPAVAPVSWALSLSQCQSSMQLAAQAQHLSFPHQPRKSALTARRTY
jgi:hypothetical protein